MEEENIGPFRRTSSRTRKMAGALASTYNRTQAALARLEALENDNAGVEVVDLNDDDQAYTTKQSKNTRRRTRHAKVLENAKKAPMTFLEVLHEENPNPCLHMFLLICVLQWAHQMLTPIAISASCVDLLPTIHV